jgi:tetratricopeptide (TPR) repeat protein
MLKQESLVCISCQTASQLNAHICRSCGQSLAASRTRYYLDLTDDDITNGRYDFARGNMAKADVEMLALSSEERKHHLLTARAFWLQSQIYYYKGQTNEAREELLLALQNLEGELGGAGLLANVLNNLGNVELYHDNLEAAAQYYQRSSEVALQAGEHAVAAKAMGNLGIVHSNAGRMDETLAWYTRALEQAELSGEPLRLGETYRLLASVYASQGPYSLALCYTEKALTLRQQIKDQACVCRIASEAAETYLHYRDLEQAELFLLEAQDIAQRTGYKLMQVPNLAKLAELMRLKGNPAAWFSYANRAFNLISSAIYQRSDATLQLIMYYISEQDWIHARKYLQLLEDNTAGSSSHVERFTLDRARALLHTALGEWDEAERCFVRAIELMNSTHDRYSVADIEEDYAAMLLKRAAAEPNPDISTKAHTVLEQVATEFRSLELPLRLATVEAKLQSSANFAATQPLSAT